MNPAFCQIPARGPSGLDLLICRPLADQAVAHGFSQRWRRLEGDCSRVPFGLRGLGDADRRELARVLKLPELAHMRQVHGASVRVVSGPFGERPACDGLATAKQGLALLVESADCLPLLLWDREHRAVAAVHAGWRGTLAGITEAALGCLKSRFGTRPDRLLVAIGPAIGACCYEVGEEVVESFRGRFPYAKELLSHGRRGRRHLDLTEANRRQLVEGGVPPGQIYSPGLCTSCANDRFYSFRKEGRGVGRLISAIGIAF